MKAVFARHKMLFVALYFFIPVAFLCINLWGTNLSEISSLPTAIIQHIKDHKYVWIVWLTIIALAWHFDRGSEN